METLEFKLPSFLAARVMRTISDPQLMSHLQYQMACAGNHNVQANPIPPVSTGLLSGLESSCCPFLSVAWKTKFKQHPGVAFLDKVTEKVACPPMSSFGVKRVHPW